MAAVFSIGQEAPRLSRRRFLGGAWLQRQSDEPDSSPEAAKAAHSEVAYGGVGILVQARPDRLTDAERAIAELGGLTIAQRDPSGRLVISPDAEAADDIGATLTAIMDLPGVLNAVLTGPDARGASHT